MEKLGMNGDGHDQASPRPSILPSFPFKESSIPARAHIYGLRPKLSPQKCKVASFCPQLRRMKPKITTTTAA
jgi:hypothetical protein